MKNKELVKQNNFNTASKKSKQEINTIDKDSAQLETANNHDEKISKDAPQQNNSLQKKYY